MASRNIFTHRSLKVVIALSCYLAIILGVLPLFSLAQEPALFEIKVIPQAEYAIAGETFTYTIVITNVSGRPLKDVIVYAPPITGTTLAGTHHINDKWLIYKPNPGETGQVAWITLNPIAPDEVVTFNLMLNILPEMVNQALIFEEYAILPQGGGDIIATGPAIKSMVRLTAPTATFTPSPTVTQTPTVMVTPTPAATQTPEVRQTATHTTTPTPISTLDQHNPKTSSSFFSFWTIIILSLLLLIGSIFGLILFFRYSHD